MQSYPYEVRSFQRWCLYSFSTLGLLTVLALIIQGELALPILVLGGIFHLLLLPAYLFRKKLGHPSWVMLPSLLPAAIVVIVIAPFIALEYFYTISGCIFFSCLSFSLWVPFLTYKPTLFKGMLIACVVAVSVTFSWHMMTTSRGKFLRDLNRIQPGMTVEEVDTIMAAYMQGTNLPPHPNPSGNNNVLIDVGSGQQYKTEDSPEGEVKLVGSMVYRHSNEGAYNADWGIVEFEGGLVTSIDFSPD